MVTRGGRPHGGTPNGIGVNGVTASGPLSADGLLQGTGCHRRQRDGMVACGNRGGRLGEMPMAKGEMERRYFLRDGMHSASLRLPSRQGAGGWHKWPGCRSSVAQAGTVSARGALAFTRSGRT
jgi:hypothetical protein